MAETTNPVVSFRVRLVPGLLSRANADARTPELTSRAVTDLNDYYALLERSRPDLTEGEWLLLMDVLNGTYLDRQSAGYLWAEITDAYDANPSLSEKWGVAVPGLIDKLRWMSRTEQLAVADAVRRFWTIAPGLDSHEALRRLGLVE